MCGRHRFRCDAAAPGGAAKRPAGFGAGHEICRQAALEIGKAGLAQELARLAVGDDPVAIALEYPEAGRAQQRKPDILALARLAADKADNIFIGPDGGGRVEVPGFGAAKAQARRFDDRGFHPPAFILASIAPMAACTALMALSGRTITLNSEI